MSKWFKNKNRFKTAAVSLAAFAAACTLGLGAACGTTPNEDDDDDDNKVTKQDTQVIKNGNFEFFDDKDGVYMISSPDSWTSGSSGNGSNSMSGIIGTHKKAWDKLTDKELPDKLKANDKLESDDENKVDYNGMLADDLPYKNTHDASEDEADDEKKAYIDNPFTRLYKYDNDGNVLNADGTAVTTYSDDDGNLFTDEAKTKALETNVLMLHNYRSGSFDGSETYYTSTDVTLSANTSAEFSVWVKTSELFYTGSDGKRTDVKDNRGAYIKVGQSVGGNKVDDFYIKNIDTNVVGNKDANNGWVKYTVYIQACDYADTTVNVTLGLGQDSKYTVEGYAFFDDASLKIYKNLSKLEEAAGKTVHGTDSIPSCTLLNDGDDKVFRTDKETFSTVNGQDKIDKTNEHYSKNFEYFLDLSTSDEKKAVAFDNMNVKAGLTVDGDNYVSSKGNGTPNYSGLGVLPNGAGNAYISHKLPENGINVTDDVLAKFAIGSDWTSNVSSKYDAKITEALKKAYTLPSSPEQADVMFILSSEGAAYEAEIYNEDIFTVEAEGYQVVSFWLKTSDMNGKVAATVKVSQYDDKDNSASFTLDTTTIDEVKIGDEENVYDGWVQCFVRVNNPVKATDGDNGARKFKITVNFGITDIKGSERQAFNNGWIAIANMKALTADKDVYEFASATSNSAELTFGESKKATDHNFDAVYGNQDITETLARPDAYVGINGNSSFVNKVESEYDEHNNHPFAGLLNKEYLDNYKDKEWYSKISSIQSLTDNDEIWNKLASSSSVQPLIIVNGARTLNGKPSAIYNYGYQSKSNASFSSDAYTAVTTRVKVSGNAVASVYLIDPDEKDVLDFKMPKLAFWYDDDGNLLYGEPKKDATDEELRANIAYSLRSDGLFEREGKLYANFNSYTVKYTDPTAKYYELGNNKALTYEALKEGVMYYADENHTDYAAHNLVNSDGTPLFRYVSGLDKDRVYNYIVGDKPDTSLEVKNVDESIAKPRYVNSDEKLEYSVTIDTIKNPELKDKWITVTFYVHTGNEAKNYKLELWSGKRNEEITDGVEEGSYVMFDYAYSTLDESGYKDLRDAYEKEIINSYRNALSTTTEFESNNENITYYENLDGAASVEKLYNYTAKYYTYTFYDSAAFRPFNAALAENGQTGYDYIYSQYDESLSFLKVEDLDTGSPAMALFVDYSTTDQKIDTSSQSPKDDDEDDDNTNTENTDQGSVWLLISSILIVVAIIIAILGIVIKDFLKKNKRKKTASRNSYNYNKNSRYVKKYVKSNGEAPETDKAEAKPAEETVNEEPATESENAEATVEETTETEVKEETETSEAEETPVVEENSEVSGAEETPAEDKTDGGESADDTENKE